MTMAWRPPVAHGGDFVDLVRYLQSLPHDANGNPTSNVERLVHSIARAASAPEDARAHCSDCNEPATRDDGLCNRCRRHRQELHR